MIRKICYISGTRADYGLMRTLLLKLQEDPEIELSICVTGMHLLSVYGETVNEIIADGLSICARISVKLENTTPSVMAKAIGYELIGMVDVFEQERPDIVLLLGDRGEMLAAALAASHLNIHIVHIHGGERSGTIDEMVRHAISKLAHFHFVATLSARKRLIRMGEHTEHIFQVGAPGLDDMMNYNASSREEFCQNYGFDMNKKIALLVFHPVVQDYLTIGEKFQEILAAAFDTGLQIICLEPNSDAGGQFIRDIIEKYKNHDDILVMKHLPREAYLNCLANVDLMLGNSSSGIIEAASFNRLVVNIGNRQNLRERGDNVIDCGSGYNEIKEAICDALSKQAQSYKNLYGDGMTGLRCALLLKALPLTTKILNKYNAY